MSLWKLILNVNRVEKQELRKIKKNTQCNCSNSLANVAEIIVYKKISFWEDSGLSIYLIKQVLLLSS